MGYVCNETVVLKKNSSGHLVLTFAGGCLVCVLGGFLSRTVAMHEGFLEPKAMNEDAHVQAHIQYS